MVHSITSNTLNQDGAPTLGACARIQACCQLYSVFSLTGFNHDAWCAEKSTPEEGYQSKGSW